MLPLIRQIWPGPRPDMDARVICASWEDVPLPRQSQHIVIGDGSLNVLSAPDGVRDIFASMERLLHPDGLLLLRIFCRPDMTEKPFELISALYNGLIGNPHILKWRLAMALHGALADGVRLADVWDAWHAAFPSPEALAQETGWRLEAVRTIDAYRGVESRYIFPTLSEVQMCLKPAFEVVEWVIPSYELGERCPIIAIRRRVRP